MSEYAGWYPQPDGMQRYWDGHQWIGESVPPPDGPRQVTLVPKDGPGRAVWSLFLVLAMGALFLGLLFTFAAVVD